VKWLSAALIIAEDAGALQRFMDGDMTLFTSTQFNLLGGPAALARFAEREAVFDVVRQSLLVRQTQLGNAMCHPLRAVLALLLDGYIQRLGSRRCYPPRTECWRLAGWLPSSGWDHADMLSAKL
jgi:hypothetical protein